MTSCDDDAERRTVADQWTETAPITRTCIEDATTHDDDEAVDQIHDQLDELEPPLPPDGGWGWAVVAAAFFANLILDGVCYTFGIIMPALQEHFDAGKGKTALVGSMLPGCYLLVGKNCFLGNKLKCHLSVEYNGKLAFKIICD